MSESLLPYTLRCGCLVHQYTPTSPSRFVVSPRCRLHEATADGDWQVRDPRHGKPDPAPLAMTLEERQAWAALHEAKRGIDRAILELEQNARRRSASS